MPRNSLLRLIAAGVILIPILPAGQNSIDERVDTLLSKLTLERKIELLGGEDGFYTRAIPEIGVPRLRMADGPMGVRNPPPGVAYAAGIGLAASWDTALAKRVGIALGEDCRSRGVSFILAPGVNIYRAPMNGRNFEYLGEDPYLAGRIATAYIQGIQSEGVVATVKHFAANNSEYDRHNVNSVIDERVLREIYLPAFESAVKDGKVGAVMDSYNLVNGQHATQNAFLNNEILKKEWGFRGLLMSDWDATYDGIAAANAGLDLEMPSAKFMNKRTLIAAVESGKVSKEAIDDKVRRLLRVYLQFELAGRDEDAVRLPRYDRESRRIALESAEASAVLLKNDGNLLPLDATRLRSIAVIGPDSWPAMPTAGGSARVEPFAAVSAVSGFADALPATTKIYWARGIKDPEAARIAALADAVVLCVGFDPKSESEGADRTYMLPPGQEELIQAVSAANPKTVVVLTSGGSVATAGWLDKVPALLQSWYAGQEGGRALANLILGKVNPSGKLPISWERRLEDLSTNGNYYQIPGTKDVKYREGLSVGYRHFDQSSVKPLFPFGFGLSYTTFAFSNLRVTPSERDGEILVEVSFEIRNTGGRGGTEVAQVYVGDPSAPLPRPIKELKGFSKVELKSGETKTVALVLDRRALSYWDSAAHRWTVAPGRFVIYVGNSSSNLPLQQIFAVSGPHGPNPSQTRPPSQ